MQGTGDEAGFSITRLVWYMIRYVQCLVGDLSHVVRYERKVEHDAPGGEQCSTYRDIGNLMPSRSVHGVHGSKTMNHHTKPHDGHYAALSASLIMALARDMVNHVNSIKRLINGGSPGSSGVAPPWGTSGGRSAFFFGVTRKVKRGENGDHRQR